MTGASGWPIVTTPPSPVATGASVVSPVTVEVIEVDAVVLPKAGALLTMPGRKMNAQTIAPMTTTAPTMMPTFVSTVLRRFAAASCRRIAFASSRSRRT